MKTSTLHQYLKKAIEKRNRRIIAEYFAFPRYSRNMKIVNRIAKREKITRIRVYQIIEGEHGANKLR